MKHRIFWYSVVAFVVSLLVTGSMLMPGVLLSRAEDSILRSPSIISKGFSLSQPQNVSAAHAMPTPSAVSVAQMSKRVQWYEDGVADSVLSKEPINGSIDMKAAVNTCVQQITTLWHKGMLMPLEQFPKAYTVYAEQRTILDSNKNPALQYWDIGFLPQSSQLSMRKMTISLDAQTGMFLAIRIDVTNAAATVDLANTAEAIAREMNMPGHLLFLDERNLSQLQTAVWKFNDTALLMQLSVEKSDSFVDFAMSMKVQNS
ncbi:hypothetical protein EPA93_35355 [Ktedonosporobacter rubrisoli]|uniref:Uncharacterized protein n=1 Tax=Ktedonosporobacter rubrisoli TaxID=2509675 RepID=A0A4P6JZD4_KTERU|nr:hypothetical protein [Ktedonosporobacter rubrisoli]QBD80965.1 hypothetical protein EPA93_35355 [Ktedonosporobacter rubrisoli]